MLEHPIFVSLATFKMADGERELSFFYGFPVAPAPNAHDASGRRPNIFPISVGYGIPVNLPQIGLGQARKFGQGLRVDLHRHQPARLLRGGIKSQRILNLYAFGEQIGFLLPLDDHLPMLAHCG